MDYLMCSYCHAISLGDVVPHGDGKPCPSAVKIRDAEIEELKARTGLCCKLRRPRHWRTPGETRGSKVRRASGPNSGRSSDLRKHHAGGICWLRQVAPLRLYPIPADSPRRDRPFAVGFPQ